MKRLREHAFFALLWGVPFLAFFWPQIALREGFVLGDYSVQFFPWMHHFSESIKAGRFPYWTSLVGCGFPLVAEGQTAAYYLPNLASYFLLPFRAAYAWSEPAHFLIGGIGFYLYARKIHLAEAPAALAATVFSFSSSYGGCFYTTGTLRVLTWLPWALSALESARRVRSISACLGLAAALGACLGLMGTAGYPQLGLYAAAYLGLVVLLKPGRLRALGVLIAGGALGAVLALPQLLPTLELARESLRAAQDASFALWGSVPPPALASLVFPEWGLVLRTSFFVGVLPLFFVVVSIGSLKSAEEKLHLFLALLFLSLAFGKYNPLYALAVAKIPFLTALRNPAKFLFFVTTSMAILAGFGFQRTLEAPLKAWLRRSLAVLAGAFVVLPAAAAVLYRAFAPAIAEYGARLAEAVYASKADKMHDLEYYYALIDRTLLSVESVTNPLNRWNVYAALLTAASLFLLRQWAGKERRRESFKRAAAALVAIDLVVMGFTFSSGFIGNVAPFPPRDPGPAVRKAQELALKSRGSAIEWARRKPALFEPSANMLHGLSDPGIYTPLVSKRYYELTKELGITDASLGKFPLSAKAWRPAKGLFDLLGVAVVVSDEPLELPFRKAGEADGRFFYENPNALPPLFTTYRWIPMPDEAKRLEFLKGSGFNPGIEALVESAEVPAPVPPLGERPLAETKILRQLPGDFEAEVKANGPALTVLAQTAFSRWRAEVDGRPAKILFVNHAFQGVFLEQGRHRVRFFLDLERWRKAELAAAAGWAAALLVMGVALWRRREAR